MPIYPTNKTYRGGFYNNRVVSGVNDRVYSAEDIRKPYDVIYTDGIKPNADGTAGNTLQVTAAGGLVINVASGFAKLGGAWFENKSTYAITLDNPTSSTRYDCVILKNDDSDAVRDVNIYIKSLDHIPTISDLTRSGDVYEVCVAYITVNAGAVAITNSNITDTRTEGSLCNVMSGVGATVVRTYRNTYYSQTANQTSIPIGIPQFDRNRDTLVVIIEGRIITQGTNYSIPNNNNITLAIGLPVVNTKIDFEVMKNVNAAGSDSVVAEVASLRNEVTTLNKTLKYYYFCNGTNDNETLSNTIINLYDDATISEYAQIEIKVCGDTFGFSDWHGAGTGASNSRFKFLRLGKQTSSNRKIVVDFSNCTRVNMVCDDETKYYALFYGYNAKVKNGKFNISGSGNVTLFNGADDIECENCEFFVNVTGDVIGLSSGSLKAKYRNCRVSIASSNGDAFGSYLYTGEYLELNSCTLMAFKNTSSTNKQSCGTYVESSTNYSSRTLLKMTDCNLPEVTRSGYSQDYTVKINNYCFYSMLGNSMFQASTKVATITGNETNTIIVNRAM